MSYVSLRWSALLIVYKHCVSAELLDSAVCCFSGEFLVLFCVSGGSEAVPPPVLPSCPRRAWRCSPAAASLCSGHGRTQGLRARRGCSRFYPIYPIYLCIAAGTRAGCAGTHPITDHTLLGRPKPCPVLPEILKMHKPAPYSRAGWWGQSRSVPEEGGE